MATSTAPSFSLMYDMRAPAFGAPATALYAAALEQCEWADRLGFAEVVLNEHHNTSDGYLPSPRVMAGAIAARTSQLRIHLSALVVTLHDPLHVAEDLAVLDVLSNGRVDVTLGAGYRREEFLMFGTNWKRRPSLMREAVRLMRAAWLGEPFEHNGTTVRVLPRPVQATIPLWLAGSSEGAAQRRSSTSPSSRSVSGGGSRTRTSCARSGGRCRRGPRRRPPPRSCT
jgi:alkanesulfonate monooxygenase SsuD/methylene tetrahydromethanopterin reductase-like flavin-dependent oxidoreductase (luciferase family)